VGRGGGGGGAAVALIPAIVAGLAALSSGGDTAEDTKAAPANTAQVREGALSASVSQEGTLTYLARPDGSPFSVVNQAGGTYTELPGVGDEVACGDVFYRVDDAPVLLLCGSTPAYRSLHLGDRGEDVRQLNRNLHALGYDLRAGGDIDPGDREFTTGTEQALEELQNDRRIGRTGELNLGQAVFQPRSLRVSKVTGELGGPARPGAPVAQATSGTLGVQINLDASQQGDVRKGDRAQITLPGNKVTTGRVARLGRIALAPAGQGASAGAATIPAYISLDHPSRASGLDQAPVGVDVATKGVKSAVSVPVTAIVGKSGGGYAVEVVGDGGQGELVAVELGLFDSAAGRVQVKGDVRAGESVVVPSL
jgi:peptidoglycan hydrolase-like protein with peptidoglycan-binding domain